MADNDEPMIKTPADFGHFLLEKELGHGGMGGVYLARDKMLDRKVGIKVMLKSLGADPKFVERFQREAQAAARLNHPNIAQIYSFGQEQGMPYIAMELVPGGSLVLFCLAIVLLVLGALKLRTIVKMRITRAIVSKAF